MPIVSASSINEVITEAIEAALLDHHSGLPAKVVNFYPATQSCDVQPLLKGAYLDESTDNDTFVPVDLPLLTDVPVIYPAGAGWALSFPLAPGDTCYLTFAQRSMDDWLGSASPIQTVAPKSARKADLSDAVCLPGMRIRARAIGNLDPGAAALVLGREDGSTQIKMDGSGNITITSAGQINLNGSSASAVLGEALLGYLTSHTHVSPGGLAPAPTGPAVPSPPQSLLSTKVKLS